MTEKENFLRIVTNMYDNIKPIDFREMTKIEKLKELNRWQNDFINITNAVEKMLNSYIILGIIPQSDITDMEKAIIEINSEYLK